MRLKIGTALVCAFAIGVALPGLRAQGQAPPAGAPPQGGAAGAQGRGPGGPPAAPKNLKVLPKEWSSQQVGALMQTFTQSLGVRCDHCHVPDPTAPPPEPGRGPRMDYSLDEKKEKDVARQMIKMVMAANDNFMKTVGDAAVPEKISCFTCHRGEDKKPVMTPEGGWTRGGFSLLPAGPPIPARGGRGES
jgi:hypothetical protein